MWRNIHLGIDYELYQVLLTWSIEWSIEALFDLIIRLWSLDRSLITFDNYLYHIESFMSRTDQESSKSSQYVELDTRTSEEQLW